MTAPDSNRSPEAINTNENGMTAPLLETASFWANAAVVGLTVLAAIAGAFALYFSSRLAATKDAELDKFQVESKVAIAAADARAAEANEKVAGAAQGTSRALSEAAAAHERAGKIELEAEQQRERAAKAERELVEIRARISDRHLVGERRKRLVDVLRARPKGDIKVSCLSGHPEPCAFAEEIVDALKAAGWNVTEFAEFMVAGTPSGLIVQVHSESAPVRAIALQQAFAAVGLTAPGAIVEGLTANDVRLVVGAKPSSG